LKVSKKKNAKKVPEQQQKAATPTTAASHSVAGVHASAATPTAAASHSAAGVHASAATPTIAATHSVAVAPTKAPTPPVAHAARDFDEELQVRLFDGFKQRYHEAQAARLQNEAAKAVEKANSVAAKAAPTVIPALVLLQTRDFEDDLEARLVDAARQKYREAKAAEKASSAAMKVTPTPSVPFTPETKRELMDMEYDLVARDFEDELYARDFDEFEARNFQDFWNSLLHKKPSVAAAPSSSPIIPIAQLALPIPPVRREFMDVEYDLAARGYFDHDELRCASLTMTALMVATLRRKMDFSPVTSTSSIH